jgi:hypothetical protein
MPRKAADKLSSLEKLQAELGAKIKAAKDKIAAEAKETDRRKAELLGAVVLKKLAENDGSAVAGIILEELEKTLTKTSDRALFGFAPLKSQTKPKGKDSAALDGAAVEPEPEADSAQQTAA